ncbi:DsbA family protein [Nocardia carnea]|uniref:DsbA family protein n=1 Tax=Nocardia carnea TaxID=37328 RepID=A0ABW7TV13_9NOCA|nr:thioredoxin domain-containing protein [Nocardia carnea]
MNKRTKSKNSPAAAQGVDRGRGILVQVAVAAVLIGLIAAIGINVALKKAERDDPGPIPVIGAQPGTDPAGVTASITEAGAIRIGKPSAARTIRVVADLQCPACRQFEASYGPLLTDAVNAGTVSAEYDIIAFLDRASSTEYSTRAANASYCAAESNPTRYQSWLQTMFEHQPAEGGDGLPDNTIIEIGESAGYSDPEFARCITDQTYRKFVRAHTLDVLDSGIQSTPSILVDGNPIDPEQLPGTIGS